jgi:thioredoxin-like negative regulator of GroEL
MKKLILYLSIFIVLMGALFAINYLDDAQKNKKYAEPAQRLYNTTPDQLQKPTRELLTDENYQNIILPDELQSRLDNKEDLIVYFFSPVCQYCKETTPQLNKIAGEVGAEYRQMNVYEFEEQWTRFNISGTPTLIAFQDGREVARIVGGIANVPGNTPDDFRKFLEEYR